MKNKVIIVAIYDKLDAYPPTLNAIHYLSKIFQKVVVIEKDYGPSIFAFPKNVQVLASKPLFTTGTVHKIGIFKKFISYLNFRNLLRKTILHEKPKLLLVYDSIALGMTKFIPLTSETQIWYHNHDVLHESEIKKLSFTYLFKKLEDIQLSKVDFFSIPTSSRLNFFSSLSSKTKVYVIPNYPSEFIFAKNFSPRAFNGTRLRLIHQGGFLPFNFQSLLESLYQLQLDFKVEMTLVGPSVEICQASIAKVATPEESKHSISAIGRIPYSQLSKITNEHHVGLALYGNHNIMVRTIGTASNKIFEYISLGLPVIFPDRDDFHALFGHYEWANFVNENYTNLDLILSNISANYNSQSKAARITFTEENKFEFAFKDAIDEIIK